MSRKNMWASYCYYKALLKLHFSKRRSISYQRALMLLWRNRQLPYTAYQLADMQKFKKSDTIFLLGSGPSLDRLTPSEIGHINQHDSFGISYSYLKPEIHTTYHMHSWEWDWAASQYQKMFLRYRESMKQCIAMVSNEYRLLFYHPHLTPELFPQDPKLCYYVLPPLIGVENRPFTDEDFEVSFRYRNILSTVIHLAVQMNYRKIVLLGVDPDTKAYFWERIPEMNEFARKVYQDISQYTHVAEEKYGDMKFEYMYPKPGRVHPFDVYLRSAESFLRRRRGVQVYVSHKTSVLHLDIPAYFP